jgi:site-specific recombinase XerD
MISIYKRGSRYWVRGSFRGQKVRTRSLDTSDRHVAELLRRRIEEDLFAGKHEAAKPSITWLQFLDKIDPWLESGIKPSTAKSYRFVARRFAAFLQHVHIEALGRIDPGVIADYYEARGFDVHPTRGRPIHAAGLASDRRCLHRLFAIAVKRGYLTTNPVGPSEAAPPQRRQTMPFTRDDVDRMMAAATPADRRGDPADLRAVILFFLSTGLRISDVINFPRSALTWPCGKDAGAGEIVLRTQKRGRVVSLPVHPSLERALAAAAESETPIQRASPYLFSTASGKPIWNLAAYLGRLWARAGIQGAHAHRFRDTFAVRILENGGTLYDVARLLGISHTVAERHYTPYVQELRDRGRRLVATMDLP